MRIIPFFISGRAGSADSITFDAALLPHEYIDIGESSVSWLADEDQGIRTRDYLTFEHVEASLSQNLLDPSAAVLRLTAKPAEGFMSGAITPNSILTRAVAENGGYSLEVEVLFVDYYQDPPDSETDAAYTTLDVAAIHDAETGERLAAICAELRDSFINVWVEVVDSFGAVQKSPLSIFQIGYPLSMKLSVDDRLYTLDVNNSVESILPTSVLEDSGEVVVKMLEMTEYPIDLLREVDIYRVHLGKHL